MCGDNKELGVAPPISADLLYLVRLADWAAGQGFCQIEGIEDPEEWCFRRWSELGPPNGDGYSADALAQAIAAVPANTRQDISDVLIEALETLRSYGCPVCSGDCASANPPVAFCPMKNADDALRQAKAGEV